MSSLKLNYQKCDVYLSCVTDAQAQELCSLVEMPRGNLLVRYLGVLLISTKLSFKDCQQIFNKIKSKIESWAAKKLSYGGRLQLIQLVLSGIYLYWFNVFMLPKDVIHKIDGMLLLFYGQVT